MDIDLARTFLEIIRSGSFIATAERLHITQTAVTARVHNLEEQLGCRLFVRNRAGARLTDDGQRFVAYATQLVQTWEAARRDLPLSQSGDKLLTLGSEVSLCNPLMLAWAQRLRQGLASHAIRLEVASGEELQKKLDLGVLDAALVHQPEYWPSLQVEQLLEEKLIQVVQTQNPAPYLYVDWGPAFRKQHNQALPEHAVEFSHGYTYSAHPVACAAGLAALDILARDNLVQQSAELAPHFEKVLHGLQGAKNVIDIRNCGLAGAIQIAPRDGDPTVRPFEAGMKLWQQGFYVRFGGDTLQFGPTFNARPEELDRLFDAVGEALNGIA